MREMTSAQIADITGGELIGGATGTERVSGKATVDSRIVAEGDLFVAFEGEHVDGHDYIQAASERGSALALVTRLPEPGDQVGPVVVVDDATRALSALARHQLEAARADGTAPTVIGLTGSSGKTSTKDLFASIVSPLANTIAPIGSRNNELGLPLTVLELTDETAYMVLEMGARGIGHINTLTAIARPDISVVLNVGSAHVGEFGSVDNIQIAKSELVQALDETGTAILNADDPRVAAMQLQAKGPVRFFSTSDESAAAWASDIGLADDATARFTLHLDGKSRAVKLQLTGEHHVSNALAAAAAASAAGVGFDDIVAGLESATTRSPGRMEVTPVRDGITLINDAYNANPDSMTVALKALAHMGRHRRTIAVLGEMLELGDEAVAAHDKIGRLAVRLNVAQLIVVGPGARAIHNGASLEGSFGGESTYVETLEEARFVLEKVAEPSDVILLKSSNGAGLARLGEQLAVDWKQTGEERA